MSNTSIRPIPTLKGMFTVPTPTQGRNFLKENKISLRSLEKTTTEKLAAKEQVRPKWMPPLRRTPSEIHADNLMASKQQHGDNQSCTSRTLSNARSQHQKSKGDDDTVSRSLSERSVVRKNNQNQVQNSLQPDRCQSCGSVRSSTNKGIQTEDIIDEEYLTKALQRCNVTKTSTSEDRNMDDMDSIDGGEKKYEDYGQYDEEGQPLSARSKFSLLNIDDNDEFMALPENEEEEAPLSGRSRATIASNATTKSKRREHKLGSRDDLRLPRYLEKEKRDKADAKEREEARDPDCPRGHILLTEEERLSGLAHAKKRFEKLINELNRMPMTAQTLRVRSRKAEIDKELTIVEDDIRIYSKAKVYVRDPNSRNL